MDVRVPNLGEGAESGTVVNVLVKEGDKVAKDQTLIELENEKAVAPIPSSQAGVVKKIYVKVGDKISVGMPIVSLENGTAGSEPQASTREAESAARSAETRPANEQPSGMPRPASNQPYESPSGMPPPAPPTVRKIAAELGIDLRRVRGSESGGRISMADLRNYVRQLEDMAQGRPGAAAPQQQQASAPAAPRGPESVDFSKWGPVEKKPFSSLRQKIAERLQYSWQTIPHVTQFDEADITALTELRKKFAPAYQKKGAALTITPFVMKAVAAALKKYPQFGSSLDNAAHELVIKKYCHIGIAVDTEAGLIVPVVRDADKKSLVDLAKELGVLSEKTRLRKVTAEELKGASFTISNLGSIGGTHFTPIVNPPEVAILGVGRGSLKPVYVKSASKTAAPKLEPRLMMPLGLSYDHRVIDGADGARFIRMIVEFLENVKAEEVKL